MNDIYIQQGWQCPVCKKVYSPYVTGCFQCGENNIKTSIGTDYISNTGSIIHPQEQFDMGFRRKEEE